MKLFGINATRFEEAVQRLESNPSAENIAAYREAQQQLFTSYLELNNLLAALLNKAAEALKNA